jgi:hypothetical protein
MSSGSFQTAKHDATFQKTCEIAGSHGAEYHPGHGGSTYLGNVGPFRDYTAPYSTRLSSFQKADLINTRF